MTQLRLFRLARPLIERLGEDFFKSAPRAPGVYVMRGSEDRILYIGQSKNLRTRLAFYKNANPDRIPRRLVRLVHQVQSITWERCASAAAARRRELELLQLHRPRFNRADTGPRFFHYIHFERRSGRAEISVRFDEGHGSWIGPIRGRTVPLEALSSLRRLCHAAERQVRACADIPLMPSRISMVSIPECAGLEAFLMGDSPDFAASLLERQSPEAELALRQLLEWDAEMLLAWFRVLRERERK